MYVRMCVRMYVCMNINLIYKNTYILLVVILHAYIKNFQNKTEARFACWLSVWASKKMGKIVAILSVSACSI